MHSCLRDLRNETSVAYIASGHVHHINLRKLNISHLKCIHNVLFTKEHVALERVIYGSMSKQQSGQSINRTAGVPEPSETVNGLVLSVLVITVAAAVCQS